MALKKEKTTTGFIWNFLERCGAQGVTFVVGIILAKILGTEAYGTVALISVFTSILVLFTGFNIGTALIRKKEIDELDLNSAFYFTAFLSIAVYLVLFFGAPAIASFYEKPELTALTRVAGLGILISIFQGNQCVVVSRNLQFKLFFFATLTGTIGAAVIGVAMAYWGFGAWALVTQSVFNTLIDTIMLWFLVKWRPKLMFSWKRVKGLLGFSMRLWVSNIADTLTGKIQQLIIGKRYSASDLALYNKGESFPVTIVSSINSSISNVLLPTISQVQDDRNLVRQYTSLSIRVGSFIIWPMMVGLAACSTPLITLILGEEWVDCALFIKLFCISCAFLPLNTANLEAIKAIGRTDIILKINIIKQVVTILLLMITMWFGPLWIAVGMVLSKIISQIVNALPNRQLFGYSYAQQIRDIMPSIALSLFMGAIVYTVSLLGISDLLTIIIQIPLGVILYCGLAKLFHMEVFSYLLSLVESLLRKRS